MQTLKGSTIEQICNVGSGMLISYLWWMISIRYQIQAFESHDISYFTWWVALFINCQFTVISVFRGLFWRRYFNGKIEAFYRKHHPEIFN